MSGSGLFRFSAFVGARVVALLKWIKGRNTVVADIQA